MMYKKGVLNLVKLTFIVFFVVFCISTTKDSASTLNINTANFSSNEASQVQDSLSKQAKDSLDEIVPYLDDISGDSEAELFFIYILLIFISTLLSEDLASIGAGLMVANGYIEFIPATLACIGGIFFGDFSLYAAGRWLGDSIFKIRPFSWFLNENNVEQSIKWFETKGPVILVMSRFVPGSRFPVYLAAGLLKTKFWKFSLYFGLTVLIWTPIFVWLSVFAGNEILTYYEKYDDYAIWILLAALIMIFGIYKYLLPLFTVRGRRIVWNKITRFFNQF